MIYDHETWSLAERVAYLEGRLGTPCRFPDIATLERGSDQWLERSNARNAWDRGRADTRDRRMMCVVKVLFVLQTATAMVAWGLVFSR
jgi:hypothetical protein